MLNQLKEKFISVTADYIINLLFKRVIIPVALFILSSTGLSFTGLIGQITHHNALVSWGWITLWGILLFFSGLIGGWQLRMRWSSRSDRIRSRIDTKLFEVVCTYNHGRIPDHVDVFREIHSRNKETLKKIPIWASYYAKSGSADIKIEAHGTGTIEPPKAGPSQQLGMNYVLSDDLLPHHDTKIGYRIVVTNRQETPPSRQSIRATYGPIEVAHIVVRFAPDALPDHVWRAQWIDGGKPQLLEELEPKADNLYETTFKSLPGGLNIDYGLYWVWQEDDA